MQYTEERIPLVKRVMTRPIDLHERVCVQIARTLLLLLPSANLSLLLYLMTFLNQIHQHGMDIEDIAALFGSAVFGARKGDTRSDARASLTMCWFLHRWSNISASTFGVPVMESVHPKDKIPAREWIGAPSSVRERTKAARQCRESGIQGSPVPSVMDTEAKMTQMMLASPWSPQVFASPVFAGSPRQIIGTPRLMSSPAMPSHVIVPMSSIVAMDLAQETVVLAPTGTSVTQDDGGYFGMPEPTVGLGINQEMSEAYGGIVNERPPWESELIQDSNSTYSCESWSSSLACKLLVSS